ncbi:MAG: hypothetical protein U0790_02155 [Isosphaeraceae bacterium]
MPTVSRVTLRERPSFVFTVVRWFLFAPLLVGVGAASVSYFRNAEKLLPRFQVIHGGAVRTTPKAAQTPENTDEAIEKATAEGTHRGQLALAKIQQREACDRAKAASAAAEEAYREAVAFEEFTNKVAQGEEGRIIGASERHLSQYIAFTQVKRPSKTATDRLRSAAAGLLKAIEGSLADPNDATLPQAPLRSEVETVDSNAREATDLYRAGREQLDSILNEAKASGAKGTLSLRDAVARRHNEETRRETERVEEARRKAREAAEAQLAAAEAEKTRLLAAKELETKKAQLKSALEQKEQERKRQLAESPAIQARFAPFLAKGRWLFDRDAYSRISAPASYSILVKQGYLHDFEAFARGMAGWTNFKSDYTISAYYFTDLTDRPRHKMPQTEAEWVEMKELFDTFRELAPLWVEMGLLGK